MEIQDDSFSAVIIKVCSLTFFSLVIFFLSKIQAKVRLWKLDLPNKGCIILYHRFYMDGKDKLAATMPLHTFILPYEQTVDAL
jgi:hypothetical protein